MNCMSWFAIYFCISGVTLADRVAFLTQFHPFLCKASGGRFGARGGGGRGHDALVNRRIKIKSGQYKGCRGLVKEVTGALVHIELESQMKIVSGECLLSLLLLFVACL